MNIIYMHTHDTGRYIEPYGYKVPTPNLTGLAKEGTVFRHAFSAAPTCSPSRSALLTGLYPHTNGMYGLAHRGFKLHDINRHIVNLLNKNNIETVLCGAHHVVHGDPHQIGYKEVITDIEYRSDKANAAKVATYLRQKKEKPFFLSFGMFNTHRDWPDINEDIDENHVMPPFPIYDNEENRKDYAAYLSSAKIMDSCVGTVLEAVKESGLEDDTFIIFTTDHGLAYPNMKCNLYDTGIGVSLITKYPSNKYVGKSLDALVSHLDIFPTICDIMNIDKPDYIVGNSILPLLEGKTEKIRDEIHAEVTYHAVYEPMRCLRTDRYKLIKRFGDYYYPIPENIDKSVAKDFMVEAGFFKVKNASLMLFDLYLDPVERVNLVAEEAYKDVLDDLSARLHKWMLDTADPMLSGIIKKPPGAIINKRSCYSPREEDFE